MSETQQIPDGTLMDKKWSDNFEKVTEGQVRTQYIISANSVAECLNKQVDRGFPALQACVKYDGEGKVILALLNPDGTYLELFPTCPPFCPE